MISVIIPVFNAEKTIVKSLLSVQDQTWKGDFEVIVVNDGSTDNSRTLIEKFIKENPHQNIKLIGQENGGVSRARNTALKICKGDFIALLDADDEWFPEKTERQMLLLENKNFNIDFIGCKRQGQSIKFPYNLTSNNLIEVTFRKLMFRNETQPSTVLFKRKVLENSGFFNENQRYAEDLNYWLKVSEKNNMFILNEELVLAGEGKRSFGVSGLSANLFEMERGFQKNLKEVFDLKRINFSEYVCYFIFYKFKYVFRLARNKYLKFQGK
ncbi:glycosyltransferase family 2 protein [Halpernia frigidisoli]|uniref:Glycosyltransferase involved in cell wall bisynthesis n=1 Tax=Halpernia frigidisoli TaxID=1125876 RepID=A0A1I3E4L6_9FLAO|nr:glycosyltransferase family A protein [Halpernia frigidisoli]SFH93930.1 Glycosyltransferase involved in cell wall bisynthesis [Halpernia frigidisoli]